MAKAFLSAIAYRQNDINKLFQYIYQPNITQLKKDKTIVFFHLKFKATKYIILQLKNYSEANSIGDQQKMNNPIIILNNTF